MRRTYQIILGVHKMIKVVKFLINLKQTFSNHMKLSDGAVHQAKVRAKKVDR